MLDLVTIDPAMTILDAGCGWGRFAWPLIEEKDVSPTNIIFSDHAENMLHIAFDEARQRNQSINACVSDVEALPFPASQFDLVMANHMLYHLSDILAGIHQLAQVVKPDGTLLATTNSENVRVMVIELHYQALKNLGIDFEPEAPSVFSMENGGAYFQQVFRQVEPFYFEDETVYASADDFVASYVNIGRYRNTLARDDISPEIKKVLPLEFKRLAKQEVDSQGRLVTQSRMGAFVCQKPY